MNNYRIIHTRLPNFLRFFQNTEGYLRRIYIGIGLPNVRMTINLLKRPSNLMLPRGVRETIESIAKEYKVCRLRTNAYKRLYLSMGSHYVRFNLRLQFHTMFIVVKPVMHRMNQATHCTAAGFLPSQSTTKTWKSIREPWMKTNSGLPGYLVVDKRSAYTSDEMKYLVQATVISLEEASIESSGTIGVFERYHDSHMPVFDIIKLEYDSRISNKELLRFYVFAVNLTVGPRAIFRCYWST